MNKLNRIVKDRLFKIECKGTIKIAHVQILVLFLCQNLCISKKYCIFAAAKMNRIRQIFFSIALFCLAATAAMADDVRVPDYQIADNTFFDPTRKEKVEEDYHFAVEYRIEAGYAQHQQRSKGITFPDMYLHGARIGATFTFLLPRHFSIQTGALYTLLYGGQKQHWRSMDAPSVQTEYLQHRVLEHNLTVPVRAFYTIPVWQKLNLFFYAGPQLHIGLAENDYIKSHLSPKTEAWLETQGIPTKPYDRMDAEIVRANIQLGVGGGLEWDRYRLQAGYDFGLNNLVAQPQTFDSPTKPLKQHMWEWGWYVSFSYRF